MKINPEEYKQKVLFSPLGRSDPARGNYDGGFIHILRYKKPQKAYIYMTKEIFDYAEHDDEIYENDRYRIFANRVCPDCQIIDVSPEDKVTDPHIFGAFYSSFETILSTIHDKNPDALIYVNISSGTPAMKSALQLLCVVASNLPLYAIQVPSPEGKGSDSKPVSLDYDIENEWNNLIDNDNSLNPQNRCIMSKDTHDEIELFARINARKLIQNYDYNAACDVLIIVQPEDPAATILLLAAKVRLALKQKEAAEYAKKAGYPLLPIKTGGVCEIFEYILYLQIKVERGEITEFARGVSPVLTNLFISYLKNIYSIDINNSCTISKDNIRKLTEQKLKDTGFWNIYDQYYDHKFQSQFLSFGTMIPLLQELCTKNNRQSDLAAINKLRNFEKDVRNKVSHQIIGITEDQLKEDYNYSSKDILDLLREFFCKTFKTYQSAAEWDSYEKMNDELIKRLKI